MNDWFLEVYPGKFLPGETHRQVEKLKLSDFMSGDKRPSFRLTREDGESLRFRTFGERLEVLGDLLVELCNDGSWVWTAAEPSKPIVTLKNSVRFQKLSLRTVGASEGPGAWLQQNPKGRPGESQTTRSPALVGIVEGVSEVNTLEVGTDDEAKLELVVSDRSTLKVALRQWGKAAATVAFMRGSLAATLCPKQSGLPQSHFNISDGLFTRQNEEALAAAPTSSPALLQKSRLADSEEAVLERFVGVLLPSNRSLDTVYGAFEICGDALPEQAPTESKDAPNGPLRNLVCADDLRPTRIPDFTGALPRSGTTVNVTCEPWPRDVKMDPAKRQCLFTEFELRALVTHYALALPDSPSDACPDGADSTALATRPSGDVWSSDVWNRLDFAGTLTSFVFGPLYMKNGVENRPSAKPPVNARGVVFIGQEPVRLEGCPGWPDPDKSKGIVPVDIALDGAKLRVRRASDLLALDFQFARLALQVKAGAARIVPDVRREIGGAGQAVDVSMGGSHLRYDDRALLIAHFPPQHVAERAYLRQVNDGVELPDLPDCLKLYSSPSADDRKKCAWLASFDPLLEGANDIFDKMLTVRGLSPDQRIAYRKKFKDAIINSIPGCLPIQILISKLGPDDDPSGATWYNLIPSAPDRDSLRQRWAALPQDQRIYIGTDPVLLDPDARAVILAIWKAYKKEERTASPDLDYLVSRMPDAVLDPTAEDTTKLRLAKGNTIDWANNQDYQNRLRKSLEDMKEQIDVQYKRARRLYIGIVTPGKQDNAIIDDTVDIAIKDFKDATAPDLKTLFTTKNFDEYRGQAVLRDAIQNVSPKSKIHSPRFFSLLSRRSTTRSKTKKNSPTTSLKLAFRVHPGSRSASMAAIRRWAGRRKR